MICTENAGQYIEIFDQFLELTNSTIEEKEKNALTCSFIEAIFQQNVIPHKRLSSNTLALSLSNIYLLNRSDSLAHLLKRCIGGIILQEQKDIEAIWEIPKLPNKVKSSIKLLDVRENISAEQLQNLVSHLSNIEMICMPVVFSKKHIGLLEILGEINSLRSLHLSVPLLTPSILKGDAIPNISLWAEVESLFISYTPPQNERLFFPKNLIKALEEKISNFTVSNECFIEIIQFETKEYHLEYRQGKHRKYINEVFNRKFSETITASRHWEGRCIHLTPK